MATSGLRFMARFSMMPLLFLMLVSVTDAQAQRLKESKMRSKYVYVYSITDAQAEELIKDENKFQQPEFYKNKVDSIVWFDDYKPVSPSGYYLMAGVRTEQMSAWLELYSDLNAEVISYANDLIVTVTRSAMPVRNAQVYTGKKLIPYDSSIQAYRLRNFSGQKDIQVIAQQDTIYYSLTNMNRSSFHNTMNKINYALYPLYPFKIVYGAIFCPGYTWRFLRNRHIIKRECQGYMLTDQPIYRPGDTLHWKASLTDLKGRPRTDEYSVVINGINSEYWQSMPATLIRPGYYAGQLVIDSTMTLDEDFTIELKTKRDQWINGIGQIFRVEDYQLNEATYDFYTEKHEYFQGDTIRIYCESRDVMGFGIKDGFVTMSASADTICLADLGSGVFSGTFWFEETALDHSGKATLIIPDSLLPDRDAKITIKAIFRNSNNEAHTVIKLFDYKMNVPLVSHQLIKSTIHISTSVDSIKEAFVNGYNENDEKIYFKNLQAPFEFNVDPNITYYLVHCTDTIITIYVEDVLQDPVITTRRTSDSVFVQITNPSYIPLRMMLFKGNKEIFSTGTDQDYSVSFSETSDIAYHARFYYSFAGDFTFEEKDILYPEKQLKLSDNLSEQIIPGSEQQVAVQVSDINGKPVAGADVTAYAVNAQFHVSNNPDMYYYQKSKLQRSGNEYYMTPATAEKVLELNRYRMREFGVDTMLYYRFRFPDSGISMFYDTLPLSNAQFAPHIYKSNEYQYPLYILLDNQLVFSEFMNDMNPFSFVASEGWHTVSVRTKKGMYTIDSVYMRKGCKLDMAVIADKHHPQVHFKSKRRVISKHECARYLPNSLVVDACDFPVWYYQGDRVYVIDNRTYGCDLQMGQFDPKQPVQFRSSNGNGEITLSPDLVTLYSHKVKITMTQKPRELAKRYKYFNLYGLNIGDTAYSVSALQLGLYDSMFVFKSYKHYNDRTCRDTYTAMYETILADKNFVTFSEPHLYNMQYNYQFDNYRKYSPPAPFYIGRNLFRNYRNYGRSRGDNMGYANSRGNYRYSDNMYYEDMNDLYDMSPNVSYFMGPGHAKALDGDLRTFRGNDFTSDSVQPLRQQKSENHSNLGVAMDIQYSDVRTNFRDHAYWQPDLVTDSNGVAVFNARFPDNTTQWASYVYVMDQQGRSAVALKKTNAYKQKYATLSLPRFMLQGDSAVITGKVSDMENDTMRIQTEFKCDGQVIRSAEGVLTGVLVDHAPVVAGEKDLSLQFGFSSGTGINDAEVRTIPVFPVGVSESHGRFAMLEKDTAFQWTFDAASGNVQLYADGDFINNMLSDLEKIKAYPYDCNEQLASKMSAMLLIEEVSNKGFMAAKGPGQWKSIRNKLLKNINSEKLFGWWPGGKSNMDITLYVMDVLQQRKNGYSSETREVSIQLLNMMKADPAQFETRQQILVLDLLLESYHYDTMDCVYHLRTLHPENMPSFDQILFYSMEKKVFEKTDMKKVMALSRTTPMGNLYWPGDESSLFYNDVKATAVAYNLLRTDPAYHYLLPRIRGYFYEKRSGNGWNNTVETNTILSAILPDVLTESTLTKNKAQFMINGQVVEKFPYTATSGDQVSVTLKGQRPVFLTAYQTTWSQCQEPVDSSFAVRTYIGNATSPQTAMQSGEPVLLIAEVQVKGPAQYVMIEVPIPAGCSYGNNLNRENKYEVHREYFKEKTSIFCEYLPAGTYRFEIELQPRYTGSYTLNPAKAELMYFPVFFGREGVKRIKISDEKTAQ